MNVAFNIRGERAQRRACHARPPGVHALRPSAGWSISARSASSSDDAAEVGSAGDSKGFFPAVAEGEGCRVSRSQEPAHPGVVEERNERPTPPAKCGGPHVGSCWVNLHALSFPGATRLIRVPVPLLLPTTACATTHPRIRASIACLLDRRRGQQRIRGRVTLLMTFAWGSVGWAPTRLLAAAPPCRRRAAAAAMCDGRRDRRPRATV